MADPEPAAAPQPAGRPSPAAAPPPAGRPFDGIPTTGQALYRFACNAKVLPKINAIGKARGYPKLVTHWDEQQVSAAYRELTAAEPSANGTGSTRR
jgi:hypothetical protein